MGPADLEKALKSLPHASHERLLSSWASGEDAAMWKIDDKRAGILTLDFLTPVVDDPWKWGEIAAANALSDVYAMGGNPFVALNIVAFPVKTLGLDILEKILLGGHHKVREAGAFLVGGHSVEDEEPKYGLSVYGEAQLSRLWNVTGAEPGNALILTKPVGTGIISTAVKADMIEDLSGGQEAVRWMSMLNNIPAVLDEQSLDGIKACTDVTGFGLSGHILDMLSAGNLDLEMGLSNIPLISGSLELADSGLLPEGAYNNRFQYINRISNVETFEETRVDMIFDPQTSGGLLIALGERDASGFIEKLKEKGFSESSIIGYFKAGTGKIELKEKI